MAKSPNAYVDTSALIAFVDRSDTYHALFRRLFSAPPTLITTPLVVAEGHAWFLRRFDRNRALQFLAMIEEMEPLRVLSVGAGEQAQATSILRQFSDQNLTMADAVGLHLLRAHKIKSCWSTDFHLGLTGVPLVIHTD
ncbi:MAG: type II toxin-antitoxin system VapC family toxin [Pirellulales bacterium]